MKCKKCGEENKKGAIYCEFCGYKLKSRKIKLAYFLTALVLCGTAIGIAAAVKMAAVPEENSSLSSVASDSKSSIGSGGEVDTDSENEETTSDAVVQVVQVKRDGKYGYINLNGDVQVPIIYDDIGRFSEGLLAVCKDEKWGFVNGNGEEVVPLIYDDAGNFSQGLAKVVKVETL